MRVRGNAEKQRIYNYLQVVNKSAVLYYEVIKTIFCKRFHLTQYICFIMDYIKGIIENGTIFNKTHFFYILIKIDYQAFTSEFNE